MRAVSYIFDKSVAHDVSAAIANAELRDKLAAWRGLALWCSGLLMAHVLFDIAYVVFLRH